MNTTFTTQLISEDLTVLVISAASPPVATLTQLLAPTIGVVSLKPKRLASDHLTDQELWNREYYKIIWLLDAATLGSPDLETMMATLRYRTEPIMAVLHTSSPVKRADQYSHELYSLQQSQQAFLSRVKDFLPGIGIYAGLDVVNSSLSPTSVLDLITSEVPHGFLVDPSVMVSPQLEDHFWQFIKDQVARPMSLVPYLVKSKSISSSDIIKQLQNQYRALHGYDLALKSKPLNQADDWGFTAIINPYVDIQKTLTYLSRQLPAIGSFNEEKIDESIKNSDKYHSFQLPEPEKSTSSHSRPSTAEQNHALSPQAVGSVEALETQTPEIQPEVNHQPLAYSSPLEPVSEPSSSLIETKQPTEAMLDKELSKLFVENRTEQKVERVKTVTSTTRRVLHRLKRRKALFVASMVSLGMGLAIGCLALLFWFSYANLRREFMNSLVAATQAGGEINSQSLMKKSDFLNRQITGYSNVVSPNFFAEQTPLIALADHLALFNQEYSQAKDKLAVLFPQVMGLQSGDSLESLSTLSSHIQKSYEELSQFQSVIQEFDTAQLSTEQNQALKTFQDRNADLRKVLVSYQQLEPLLPTLLGVKEKRTYALVLQNNQELRPTGGYIQAVALITFDKGVLIDSQVFNVYDLDNKLGGTVTPPEDIQRLLGEQRWYTRDSNWDPDFPTTASVVTSFLEKSTGKRVDGVVGINLYTVQEVLNALGPLDLPEYNEVITDKNLFERMEFHSEVHLVPSTTRIDYSTTLLTRLLQKITTSPGEKTPFLMNSLFTSIQSKDTLIALTDPQENLSLNSLGWTGMLATPQCPTQFNAPDCVVDTLAEVEANVGINKANYHVSREISHTIELDEKAAQHTRTLVLKNTSRTNAWPQGTYKSYIRWYVPEGSMVTGLTVNGVEVSPANYKLSTEHGKVVVGVLVETPIQSQTALAFKYRVPLPSSKSFAYVFFNQQQPGVKEVPSQVIIQHTPTLVPNLIAPQAQLNGNQIVFSPTLVGHFFGGVEFK